jgi:hypothetical protein
MHLLRSRLASAFPALVRHQRACYAHSAAGTFFPLVLSIFLPSFLSFYSMSLSFYSLSFDLPFPPFLFHAEFDG